MILEFLVNLITGLIKLCFSWVNLPSFPESATTAINTYLGYIFDNLGFLNFFVHIGTLKIIATVAIGLFAFEHMYKIVMWIIKKIPLSVD